MRKIRDFMKQDDNKRSQDSDATAAEISRRADKIIRNHVAWSMGAGLIPIPIADFFAVSAVQLDMIRQLSRLHNIQFKETEGKAVITALAGSGLSRLGANAAVKFIPGLGSVVGGVAMSALSGASTFALGQVFKTHFETGGTFLDLDTDRFRKYYDEQFEKGKKVARDIQEEHKKEQEESKRREEQQKKAAQQQQEKSAPKEEVPKQEEPAKKEAAASDKEDILKKLRELAELKEMGVITDEEFTKMKKRLVDNF